MQQSQPTQPKRNASRAEQPATPDPRGTDASPVVVKIQPTPKTDEETAKEKAQIDQQESTQRWTKGLGIATGILGLLQLIAIGFQVGIARRQNQIIEKQNAIMTGQRDAADTQSDYMRDGLAETRKAADAAREAADTASKSLKADSAVVMSIGDLQVLRLANSKTKDFCLRVQYRIHNASKNPAHVEEWGGTILLPDEQTGTDISSTVDETFAPGKGLHFPLDTEPFQSQHFAAWDRNSLVLRIELWVRVVDPQGVTTTQHYKRLVICGVSAKPQSVLWSGGQELN